MKLKSVARQTQPTIQNVFLNLTEMLVRDHGLSLNFLAPQEKSNRRPTVSPAPTYQPSELLTAAEAAGILGLSSKTLANWRVSGKHPLKYCRIGGAIRYLYSDVQSFANLNKRSSTSEKSE